VSVWRLCQLRRFLLSAGTRDPGNIVSGSVVSARILSLEGYGVYLDSVSRVWLYYAGSAGWGVFLHGQSGGMDFWHTLPSDEDGIPDGLVWGYIQQDSGITSCSSVQVSACACIVVFTLCYIYFPIWQVCLLFCQIRTQKVCLFGPVMIREGLRSPVSLPQSLHR